MDMYVENKYSEYYCYGCALVTLQYRSEISEPPNTKFGKFERIVPFPGARFSKVPKLFGWQKSLCTFNRDTFRALKLCSYFADHSFKSYFFGPDKLPGLSRNGPEALSHDFSAVYRMERRVKEHSHPVGFFTSIRIILHQLRFVSLFASNFCAFRSICRSTNRLPSSEYIFQR